MQKFIETTGDTRDAAIQAALLQLGMDRDDVSVEVLDNGKRGFLGFGATPARVRVTYEVPDEPIPTSVTRSERKPEQQLRRESDSKAYQDTVDSLHTTQETTDATTSLLESIPVSVENSVDTVENSASTEQKLSITTDDITPRLVKSVPRECTTEQSEQAESNSEKSTEHSISTDHESSERISHRGKERNSSKTTRKPHTKSSARNKPSGPKERELIPVSESCMKEAEKLAITFLTGLLEKMNVKATFTVLPQVECDQLRIEISGEDMGPVIGRRGDTLDAIQYITSLVLNNTLEEHVRLSVDTENYRQKRIESLERLARKVALKVMKSRRSMTLEPMNPYERRIIHAALQDFNGITTYSVGTDPGRRVVIAPVSHSHS